MMVLNSRVVHKLSERDTIGKLTEELLEIVDNLSEELPQEAVPEIESLSDRLSDSMYGDEDEVEKFNPEVYVSLISLSYNPEQEKDTLNTSETSNNSLIKALDKECPIPE